MDCHPVLSNEITYIWNWIQKYNPQKISSKKKKVLEYYYIQKDGTVIKIGSELIWL